MKKVPGVFLAFLLTGGLLVGFLASENMGNWTASVAEDCDGKPYGTSGCPLVKGNSTSVAPGCGNGKVDGDEECDNGEHNGTTGDPCSALCRLRYCGDGVIHTDLQEECEPPADEFYRATGSGDELIVERVFNAPRCGNYCEPPQCDEDGVCEGGCTLSFLPACQSGGSSSAGQATQASSAASRAAASSVRQQTSSRATSPATSSVASAAGISSSAVSSSTSSASAPAGLTISMEGPLAVQTGLNAIFTITIKNYSDAPVQNATVTDYLLNYGGYGGFTLEAATGGANCRLTGVTVRCTGIQVGALEAKSIKLAFVFQPSTTCVQRSVQAYATVASELPERDKSDNETELVWTTVRCNKATGIIPSSQASSKADTGTGEVIGTGTGSSMASLSSAASSSSTATVEVPTPPPPQPTGPAVCGDGKQAGDEECDDGSANGAPGGTCSTECRRTLPTAPETTFDKYQPLLLKIAIGWLVLLIALYAFVKRKAIMGLFRGEKEIAPGGGAAPKSIDDVPLDEIEMPWRKF